MRETYRGAMNLDELHWFVVLAEAEHMTDAAAELSISQPTLSRALGRLEARVGCHCSIGSTAGCT